MRMHAVLVVTLLLLCEGGRADGEEAQEQVGPAGKGSSIGADRKNTLLRPVEYSGGLASSIREFFHGGFMSVAISPDGHWGLCGGYDGRIRLWELEKGKELRRFLGHTDVVAAVAFSPDGKRLISASSDHTVRLWDVETGKELQRIIAHRGVVQGVSFSPDGRRAASVGDMVRLWDLATGKQQLSFQCADTECCSFAFCPDGKRMLIGCYDHSLRLVDLASQKELRSYKGHTDYAENGHTAYGIHVAISRDGRLAVSGRDLTVRLWEIDSGKQVLCLRGHTLCVECVAISPDGKRALSGANDKTVRLWDLQSGKELSCFKGHKDHVLGVAFSPDGKFALSGGMDNTVRLWTLPKR